jgi:hypothetical protein
MIVKALLRSSVVRPRVDAKFLNHGDQHGVLVFEMAQNHLDLLLSPDIHLQIMLRTHFRVAAHQVLANHDQRHEQNLNHVGNEQPEHESHRRIELPSGRSQHIPAQPADGPSENAQEEPHRADADGDPECQTVQRADRLEDLLVNIPQGSPAFDDRL